MYRLQFLSDFIAKKVALVCSVENKHKLEAEHFDYLVAEAIMCHGLMQLDQAEVMDERWTYQNWKFFEIIQERK